MKKIRFTLATLLVLTATAALAAVPQLMNFQGMLKDGFGNPVANAAYSVVFKIYDAPTAGTVLWTETQSVTTTSGLFTVLLGASTPVPDSVFNDSSRYLGIQVGLDPEMTPRQKLVSVGYTFRTEQWTSAAGDLLRLNGNVGIGTAPGAESKLDVQTSGSFGPFITAVHGTADETTSGNSYGGYFVAGPNGVGFHTGVLGQALGSSSTDVYGGYFQGNSTGFGSGYGVKASGSEYGVYGSGIQSGGWFTGDYQGVLGTGILYGVFGSATQNGGAGLYGYNSGNVNAYGVYSSGDARVSRNLTVDGDSYMTGFIFKIGGGFRIDHPTDPANKYLYHSFVESPDMTNLYNGNVTLDAKGEATVELPDWFGALNKDFRYQLTAIGAPGPNLYVAQEVTGNVFRVAGGTPGMKVSWQVTGIRQDAYASAHRIPVELDKSATERGKYLHPKEQGMPETLAMSYEEIRKMDAVHKKLDEERKQQEVQRAKMEQDRLRMGQDGGEDKSDQ